MKEINPWDNKNLLKILPFYNILIDSPKIKKLSNVDILNELPFWDSLSIKEISKAFRRYAKSFSIEIIDSKDPLIQLNSSKPSIKDLFKNLLYEMKRFKYQITMNISLSKEKTNGDTEYSSVYFNSITKTVISLDFNLDKSFEEILYRIDNWINEGSGWIIDSINGEYVNNSKNVSLFGNSFVELPSELNHPKKGLTNIKNRDNKCFLWCHDKNSERISKKDKKVANAVDYLDIVFPVSKKYYCKIEEKNSISINVFSYGNVIIYPIYVPSEKFNNSMDLLLIFSENKSHYVYIKDFIRRMFSKCKIRIRSTFVDIVYNVLVVKVF